MNETGARDMFQCKRMHLLPAYPITTNPRHRGWHQKPRTDGNDNH